MKKCTICEKEYTPCYKQQKCCSRICMGRHLSKINTGKKHTADTKEKLRQINLGKTLSEETKKKISLKNLGRTYSAETLMKYSTSKKGVKNPMYGRSFSDEHHKRLSESRRKWKLTLATRQKISLANTGKNLGVRNWLSRDPKKLRESIRAANLRPEVKLNRSNAMRKRMENPLVRENISRKRKEFLIRNPDKHPCKIMGKKGFISKPQQKMYDQVNTFFSNTIMNHPVQIKDSIIYIDVAVPEKNLGFEFDGKYWHRNQQEQDNAREKELISLGWNIFRFNEENISELINILNKLVED